MKRDVENTFVAVEQEFSRMGDFIPQEYTVEEPYKATPFMMVLVHTDHNWTGTALTGLAGVYTYYVDPLPPQMLENENVDNNGQWVLVYEINAVALIP